MLGAPLLIDVSRLRCEHTDAALEFLHKAIGEDLPPEDIWAPHANPYVRRLVELFTTRGLERSAALEAELKRWLTGGGHVGSTPAGALMERPVGAMRRWTPAELGVAKLYLENLPVAEFTLDDWMLVVDYLVQRYLAPDDLRTESDWLATRSAMMGRIAASLSEKARAPTEGQLDTYLVALSPITDELPPSWQMTGEQRAVIDFGRARCAEFVTALSDAFRHRMRKLIVDWQEALFLGDKAGSAESIQGRLLDEFGALNRDWRRIAVTEATENINQGFIASCEPGARVKRVEKYRGACPFCRSINGKVFTVVDPHKADKNGDTEVWVGKTNVGRSASPRRREGNELVEREPHEMWWAAAGAMHPHCRGAWVRTTEAPADPIWDAWLDNLRKRKGAPVEAEAP
jgi:hypothetical protein